MSTASPTTIRELADIVAGARVALPHGAQTKPALCAPGNPGATRIDTTAMRGITDYQPGEFVITALAGTPVSEIEAALAEHGQHLPFDPPLAAAGSTIGGAIASGLNGPCRLRYGGVRDFVIGMTFVDGRGRVIKTGGKVIKNVAGFDFAKLLVGSFGRLAAIAEITLKVFPSAESHLTVGFDLGHIDAAINAVEIIASSQLEPYAIDIHPPGRVHLRLGGSENSISAAGARAESMIEAPSARIWGANEGDHWAEIRDFSWAKGAGTLLKIPVTTRSLSDLDFTFGRIDAQRRYSFAGNVAFATVDPKQLTGVGEELENLGLTAVVLRGDAPSARIGARPFAETESRIKAALDPSNKFLPLP